MTHDITPHWRERYLAYVDVMGFKQFVREHVTKGSEQQAIAGLHGIVDQVRSHVEAFQDVAAEHLSMRVFSDLICLSLDAEVPRAARVMQTLVGYVLLNLVVPEPSLGTIWKMYAGEPTPERAHALRLFARGAIVRQMHYSEGDVVFSPALIDGYEAEQQLAIFPRVIILPSALPRQSHPADEGSLFWDNMMWRDFDGHFFVNYLNVMLDRQVGALEWVLAEHRETILRNLSMHSDSLRLTAKYRWLASYHNAFCQFAATQRGLVDAPMIEDGVLPGHRTMGTAAKEQSQ